MTCSTDFGTRPSCLVIAVTLLAVAVSGCASGKHASASGEAASASAAAGDVWGLEHTREAIALLNAGQPEKARAHLVEALKDQPGDMIAQSLIKQIDTDPQALLGSESYAYTLKEGDTMSGLAQRFLGTPLMSYALARYNGLASPMAIHPGQSIRIPGKPKPAPSSASTARKPAEQAKKPKASATPAQSAAKPPQPAANPAQAAKLRGQGLAAMNAGAIGRAVSLLRQALAQEPNNALIRNDLARALRIQSTLNARP